jgi:hypothetical protein
MQIKLKASGKRSPGIFPGGFMTEASFLNLLYAYFITIYFIAKKP